MNVDTKMVCSIVDCERPHKAKGYCNTHYMRLLKYGDPTVNHNPYHKLRNTPEYKAWCNLKARCNDPNTPGYRHYGARGIKVCERWSDSFLDFLADMGKKPSPKHSIDRIDPNGDYEPSNCRWATRIEQARNTTKNRTYTLTEIIEAFSLSYELVWSRIKRGATLAEAVQKEHYEHSEFKKRVAARRAA